MQTSGKSIVRLSAQDNEQLSVRVISSVLASMVCHGVSTQKSSCLWFLAEVQQVHIVYTHISIQTQPITSKQPYIFCSSAKLSQHEDAIRCWSKDQTHAHFAVTRHEEKCLSADHSMTSPYIAEHVVASEHAFAVTWHEGKCL